MATDILITRIHGGDRGVTTAPAVGDPHGAMGGAGMQAPTFMADGATPPMPGLARPGSLGELNTSTAAIGPTRLWCVAVGIKAAACSSPTNKAMKPTNVAVA